MLDFLNPFNLRLGRSLETFSVFVMTLSLACSLICSILMLLNPFIMPLMLFYFAWIYLDSAPIHGGRKLAFVRSSRFFRWFRDYFPITLVKTSDLPLTTTDPDTGIETPRTYVLGYHPHGIIGVGAMCNFATEATGFGAMFPGLNLRLLTMHSNFKVPFHRELLLSLGVCSVNEESCNHILSLGAGNAIMIVVGGAKEALDAHPGAYTLTLANRKGFVRVALQNGSSLVPVISFGETDLYEQVENPEGSRLRRYQDRLQKHFGMSFPLVKGRGVFGMGYGILPHRKPIHTVVGAPIHLPKIKKPTREQISEYHSLYIEKLRQLFEDHKAMYLQEEAQLIVK
eukprot:TRINITY_DN12771_c0_g1_i1.p1 TRINITY_DN12771_c0_g1~~TRINITY_DN12771_c0_g1_i1.p1  ORF type:complete len:341 (-),score=42.29 TRINITY_DN12771_c0_g1_i1:113-1135(-)